MNQMIYQSFIIGLTVLHVCRTQMITDWATPQTEAMYASPILIQGQ